MNTLSTLKHRVIAFSTLITLGAALIGVAVFHKEASLIEQKVTKSTLQNPSLDELKKQYQTEFKQEEQALMQEFFAMTDIDEQDWSEYRLILQPIFLEDNNTLKENVMANSEKQLPSDISNRIHNLMQKTGLDTNKIGVIGNRNYFKEVFNDAAMMCAFGDFILINEKALTLNQFSKTDIDAMLLHEMHHVLYEDYLNKSLMYMFIHQYRPDLAQSKAWTTFFRKYNHFMERRVDISVGFVGKEYCESRLNCAPDDEESDHSPSKATHVAYMSKLLNQLQALENHATQSDGN